MSELLHVYLNDHLAGAIAGGELARRAAAENEDSDFGAFLTELVQEIEIDRLALEALMETVGATRDLLKGGSAWIAEKLGRLKLNGQVSGYSPLSRLLEFEALASGIEAKLCLWRTLQVVLGPSTQLDDLVERGERQRAALEGWRLRAAEIALGDPSRVG